MSFLTLNNASIAILVNQFYDEVRADPVLAPVFNGAIGDRWEAHLARMVDFWSTVMLGSRDFQGNVFAKHMQLNGVTPTHFARWLELFNATSTRLFAPSVAEEFMTAGRRIATSLQYGYFGKAVV